MLAPGTATVFQVNTLPLSDGSILQVKGPVLGPVQTVPQNSANRWVGKVTFHRQRWFHVSFSTGHARRFLLILFSDQRFADNDQSKLFWSIDSPDINIELRGSLISTSTNMLQYWIPFIVSQSSVQLVFSVNNDNYLIASFRPGLTLIISPGRLGVLKIWNYSSVWLVSLNKYGISL